MGRGRSKGGASGSKATVAAIVTTPDGQRLQYEEINGTLYNTTDVSPEEVEGLTLSEVINRVQGREGYSVQTLTQAEMDKREEERKEARKETEEILNRAYLRDETFVKGSRQSRIAYRQHKRKRG